MSLGIIKIKNHTGIRDNREEKLKRRRKIATRDGQATWKHFIPSYFFGYTEGCRDAPRRIPRSLLAAAAIRRKNAENR